MLNRSGMALVLALMAVSFLMAVTVQLLNTVNWQVKASTNYRDSVSIDAMNRSALNIARASLLADQNLNNYDSPYDEWNQLGGKGLQDLLGSDNLAVTVTDLSGRLQVNALVSNDPDLQKRQQQEQAQYEIWLRFLTSGRFAFDSQQQAIDFLDAIRDWIDSDDQDRDHGAEEGYYLSLARPYRPRNAPLQTLEELLLVRGMTDDIFYGNEEYSGIIEYLTCYGTDGRININSAPAPVLQALAEGLDDEMVHGMIDFREDEGNKDLFNDPQWYRQVSAVPGYITLDQRFITVKSYYFTVASSVRMGDFTRTGSGVIYRDDKGVQQLLRWDVD